MNRVQAFSAIVLLAVLSVFCNSAQAEVVVTVEELGGDVVASGGGSLDLSLWTFFATFPDGGSSLDPNLQLVLGPPVAGDAYFAALPSLGLSSPGTTIGPGTDAFDADSAGGAPLGVTSNVGGLFVPAGYSSGDPIVGSTATFANQSFASLGIAPGTYTWTWNTAAGGTDSFTVEIVAPAPACACELDGVAGVDVFDLLAYLHLWLSQDPAAERTGDDPIAIDVFDLLDYLDCWFAGCP